MIGGVVAMGQLELVAQRAAALLLRRGILRRVVRGGEEIFRGIPLIVIGAVQNTDEAVTFIAQDAV